MKTNMLIEQCILSFRFEWRQIYASSWRRLASIWAVTWGLALFAAEPPVTNSCDRLHRLTTTMDLEHAWSGTQRLRELEFACSGLESDRNYWQKALYWQSRATAESLLGNHSRALSFRDMMIRNHPGGVPEQIELPQNTTSILAIPYVIARARNHEIVIVNEEHHVSTDRLFTLALLQPLYEQGFRYFAVEALWTGERGLNERGYPIRESGGYVSDVLLAEVIRTAVSLGYKIVPYESTYEQNQPTVDMNAQQVRDYWQAQNLISETIELDANAKVLVHCGLQHIEEAVSPNWWPMAYYFREATGLDPLTVDQTLLAERGADDLEHSWRRHAEVHHLVAHEAVILVDRNGAPLQIDSEKVDMHILNPRTTMWNGRPTWMEMDGHRVRMPIHISECEGEVCVIEVFHARWAERAVPYDRIEVSKGTVDLYLPSNTDVDIRAYRLDGSSVFRRTMKTPI